MAIPPSMTHLPTHRGLPVPYVAIWEQERVGPGIEWTPTGIKAFAYPEYLRYSNGIWWLDTPDRRGHGAPIFGGTHSTRQRNCMTQGRCQVCGRKLRNDKKGPLLWAIPHSEEQRLLHDEHNMILNPPTCAYCYKAAQDLCPHLKAHNLRIFKGTPRIAGIHGTLVHSGNRTEIVYLKFTTENVPALKFLMGRQLLITLTNEVEVTDKYRGA